MDKVKVSHKQIVEFHKYISEKHVDINGFYRFNWNEIEGIFRSGVGTPALLLESMSSDFSQNPNKTTSFNHRRVSFLVLDFAGNVNDFDKQEAVLDQTESIALEISAYLNTLNKDSTSWLYGLYEVDSLKLEKVGPIFDNMYGWNVLYTIKNKQTMVMDDTKWNI
ncbi:hypothetical protein HX071_08610 [Myroides marinus]|uniref:hypothetical protein n=1 Tax=Myroides marinus TaxID=703342 RepID=UPI0025785856|nr:hypothetical protein [Myroides marinus]MDM1502265.1 hypothetical protein [Myroides marinus]